MATPDELIDDARVYASLTLAGATGALNSAINAVQSLGNGIPLNPVTPPDLVVAPPEPGDPGSVPTYSGPLYMQPRFDVDKPNLRNISNAGAGSAPTKVTIPSFYFPDPPSVVEANGQLLANPPVTTDLPDIPTPPDLLAEIAGITPPEITPIVIPEAPQYIPPTFDGKRPLFEAELPEDLDQVYKEQYETSSAVMRDVINGELERFIDKYFPEFHNSMAAIESRLQTYLAGGTALTPAVEDQIFNRAVDKVNAETRRAVEAAYDTAAKSGFTIPPISLLAAAQAAEQAGHDNNSRAAVEIAIKQAELEQQNLQFAVTQSIALRQIAVNAGLNWAGTVVQVNGQALQYARDVVDQLARAFDLAAKYAEIQARLYEADAAVYRVRLEGAMALIEAFTAEVNALKVVAEVDKARVDAYTARIGAVQAEADVYRAMISGYTAQADIERTKVSIYQAKVDAYAAQVNANTAKYQGYEALIRGKTAEVQAWSERVRAYSAEVSAYGERIRAESARIQGEVAENEALTRQYVAEIDAFRALVAAEAEQVRANVDSYQATIAAFNAKANAISEKSRAEVASFQAAQSALIEAARFALEQLQESNRMLIARADGMARISTAAAAQYAQVASSSLSGMNSLAANVKTTRG